MIFIFRHNFTRLTHSPLVMPYGDRRRQAITKTDVDYLDQYWLEMIDIHPSIISKKSHTAWWQNSNQIYSPKEFCTSVRGQWVIHDYQNFICHGQFISSLYRYISTYQINIWTLPIPSPVFSRTYFEMFDKSSYRNPYKYVHNPASTNSILWLIETRHHRTIKLYVDFLLSINISTACNSWGHGVKTQI